MSQISGTATVKMTQKMKKKGINFEQILKNHHYYMTYYIELLCNNFHYQSVKTITDWLYPCSNEITDWEILNKHS